MKCFAIQTYYHSKISIFTTKEFVEKVFLINEVFQLSTAIDKCLKSFSISMNVFLVDEAYVLNVLIDAAD